MSLNHCVGTTSLRLTEKHLPDLFRQLKKHASRWKEIGVHLEFLPGELSNIEARPNLSQGAPVSWLGALLEEFLQWAPGDSRGSTGFATLDTLKTSLRETGLGATAHDLTIVPLPSGQVTKRSSHTEKPDNTEKDGGCSIQ